MVIIKMLFSLMSFQVLPLVAFYYSGYSVSNLNDKYGFKLLKFLKLTWPQWIVSMLYNTSMNFWQWAFKNNIWYMNLNVFQFWVFIINIF